MKHFCYLIVTLVLVALFTSESSTINSDSRLGTTAPNFTIGNEEDVVSLKQFRGKYVLLSIWSSADANSRLANMKFNKMAQSNDKLVQLSVNFDRSRALFGEIVAADSLDTSSQYFCETQDRNAFKQKWGIADNYCTFLINTKGVVIAVNPSEKELAKALK